MFRSTCERTIDDLVSDSVTPGHELMLFHDAPAEQVTIDGWTDILSRSSSISASFSVHRCVLANLRSSYSKKLPYEASSSHLFASRHSNSYENN